MVFALHAVLLITIDRVCCCPAEAEAAAAHC